MSADAMWQLQKAVYTKLTSDTNLMALVNNNIYENVPEETPFPFVIITDLTETDISGTESSIYQINFFIESFSRERGNKKGLEIVTRIKELLNNSALNITSFELIKIVYQNSKILRLEDGITYKTESLFEVCVASV